MVARVLFISLKSCRNTNQGGGKPWFVLHQGLSEMNRYAGDASVPTQPHRNPRPYGSPIFLPDLPASVDAYSGMLWAKRKRLPGSYIDLTLCSLDRLAP